MGADCDTAAMRSYTIHEQVTAPYDFFRSLEVHRLGSKCVPTAPPAVQTRAIPPPQVAIEALDPEVLVLLAPGAGLGGAIGQVLARMGWRGIDSKSAFTKVQQSERPALITSASQSTAA